jgi:hypothetical protein
MVTGSLSGGNARESRLLDILSDKRKELLVNVTLTNLAPCKKLMRVEVDAQKVDET